jgi:hypothetical protein
MFLGQHLQAASTATTINGGTSLREKLDFTGFNYVNRSHGVGASVGLMDDKILTNPLALSYWYLEPGYKSDVQCIYNRSTAYSLEKLDSASTGGLSVWEAQGRLPNSDWSGFEIASYVGWGNATIVAIGVYSRTDSTRRILGIAAGDGYEFLNATQCETFYEPTIFNVSVEIAGKNITISSLTSNGSIQDIEPSGMLTFLTNWQFSIIASDQTSLYSSLIGNSFNTSIVNYQAAQDSLHGRPLSIENATLPGLQNSINAMIDSMLTGYASAQIMVARETRIVKATVGVQAMRFGDFKYILAVAVISFATLVLIAVDAWRTKVWTRRPELDFMNTNDLIMGMAAGYEKEGWGDMNIRQAKEFRISLKGLKLVLRNNAPSTPGSSDSARPSLDSLIMPATGSITA